MVFGLLLTIVVFAIATFLGKILSFNVDFIPDTFITHATMIVFSLVLIYGLRGYVSYHLTLPSVKKSLNPFLFGVLTSIIVNFLIAVITLMSGNKTDEIHPVLSIMSPLQIFIFIFIVASIAEETLFRGFLVNFLKPLKYQGIKIFKRKISTPVLIGAVVFGLAHLSLITTGISWIFLLRIVIFTMIIGLIAGYYQEKYDNIAYAIIVHMEGN